MGEGDVLHETSVMAVELADIPRQCPRYRLGVVSWGVAWKELAMTEKVLLVDDDPNILSGFKRYYRKRFDLLTAASAEEALAHPFAEDPVAVIVSDMNMPGMDGLQLLRKINDISPDTVRIMITGNTDQETALNAINEGSIFRFFSKPCSNDVLGEGIEAGIAEHKRIVTDREFLEQTYAGGVKALIDLLVMADPDGFQCAQKIGHWATDVATVLKLKKSWQLNMATMLLPLGNITIPPKIRAKISMGMELSIAEQNTADKSLESARDLIANIPRLKPVSEAVYFQNKGFDGSGAPADGPRKSDIPQEGRILKILIDLEAQTSGDYPNPQAFKSLYEHKSRYDPDLLEDIRQCLETDEPIDEDEEDDGLDQDQPDPEPSAEAEYTEIDPSEENHPENGIQSTDAANEEVPFLPSSRKLPSKPQVDKRKKNNLPAWLLWAAGCAIAVCIVVIVSVAINQSDEAPDYSSLVEQFRLASEGAAPMTNVYGGIIGKGKDEGRITVTADRIPQKACVNAGWVLAQEGGLTINGLKLLRITAAILVETCARQGANATITWSPGN